MLMSRIKAEKNGNRKDKLKLLKMISTNEIKMIKEAVEKLDRGSGTISIWLDKYRKGGLKRLLASKKVGRPKGSFKYLNKEQISKLKEALNNEQGFRSYKEIQVWVKKEFNVKIPYTTLWNLVRKNLKAKLKVPRPVNVKKDIEKEEAFKKTLKIKSER